MNRDELDTCIDEWRDVTTATDSDLARTQQRLEGAERPAGYDASELKDHLEPSRGAAARVQARLRAHSQPPPAPWGWSAGMAVVMTTAALLLLSIGGPPTLQEDPWEDEPVLVQEAPPAPALRLDAALSPARPDVQATEHVHLRVQGDGELRGEAHAPRISWTSGALDVAVQPDRGVDLQVSTAEADVSVIGTDFTVERDALAGTRVVVRLGQVRVVCKGTESTELFGGDELLCPARAALLGDARRMARGGDHFGAVIAATRGLRMGSSDALAAELLFVRLESRVAEGAREAARVDARAYLDLTPPGPREATVRELLEAL